jgi:SAM-dependent methyltransferase
MIQASPETWDEVARHYVREIAPAERNLAEEIAGLLDGIGLRPPARLIEVGAGSGHLSLLLQERGYDTTLLDFSAVALEHARAMYAAHGNGDEGKRFILGDAFDLPRMELGSFDLAWNSGVCEHFDSAQLQRMLRNMAAVARSVLIVVPNPHSIFYLAGKRRAIERCRWIYGVELLRRNYKQVFHAAGIRSVRHGFLGRGMTRDWIRLAVGAESAPLFEKLLDEGHMPQRELYLQYFMGTAEPEPTRDADEEGMLPPRDLDSDAFDRTLSLDALGTTMVALAKVQAEADRYKAEATSLQADADQRKVELAELQERLQAANAALAAQQETLAGMQLELNRAQEAAKAEKAAVRAELDAAQKAACAELAELKERLQAASDALTAHREALSAAEAATTEARVGWQAAHDAGQRLLEACHAWRRRALALEASTSWRITAPMRRLQLLRRGEVTTPSFVAPDIPALPQPPPAQSSNLQPIVILGREGARALEMQVDAMRRRLASGVRSGLTIVTCGFDFDITVNQRPINLAREAAASGHSVVFVAWEWSADQPSVFRNQLFEGDILQVGRFDFTGRTELFTSLVLAAEESFYILSVPSRDLCDAQHVLRGAGCAVIYDVMDDWEEFAAAGQAPWFERPVEENAVLSADLVATVSPPLAAKFASFRQDIAIVPNGFSPRVLGERLLARSPAREGEQITVGYFGHLTDAWFDWPLVFDALEAAPDLEMEVIGYGEPEWVWQKAVAQPRLHLLGKRPPSELARNAARWQVATIPFRRSVLAEAVDPIKIYEYLYFRLPVVATGIPHLRSFPATQVAEDVPSFVDALRRAGRGAAPDETALNAFLAGATWRSRYLALQRLAREHRPLASLFAPLA